jgi:threonine dehydratase
MSNFKMIMEAYDRIAPHTINTPLLSSHSLNKIAQRKIWVKAECLQHTGSFKYRGGWSAISALWTDEKSRGVITFSSGNHAQGIAAAAAYHDVPATIIMPSDSPGVKIKNTIFVFEWSYKIEIGWTATFILVTTFIKKMRGLWGGK